MDSNRAPVCLERGVELDSVRLRLRDWPGLAGPLVYVPDPLFHDATVLDTLGSALAWRYRILSVQPRGASPYQVDAVDLLATLDQFGFESPVLVGERLGCLVALLVAAWHVSRIGGLVLIDPTYEPPSLDRIEAHALRDCPPDWPGLRQRVHCPVLVLPWTASPVAQLETFLSQLAPVLS